MPPRKKVKTDRVQDGATTSTGPMTRSRSKAAKAAAAEPEALKVRIGSLKQVLNLAVEVQLMIFENLHPQDLLGLSRTSKTLRGFFLHRSNEALWVAALKTAGDLPERPPWMSVPAFAHLLYSPHCHNCGCPDLRRVIWLWFGRYCAKCLPKVTIGEEDVARRFSEAGCKIKPDYVLHYIRLLTPGEPRNTRWGVVITSTMMDRYLKRQVDELIGEVRSLMPAMPR